MGDFYMPGKVNNDSEGEANPASFVCTRRALAYDGSGTPAARPGTPAEQKFLPNPSNLAELSALYHFSFMPTADHAVWINGRKS